MTQAPSSRVVLLAAVPKLRAFAVLLCGNVERADDLVQQTVQRALANIRSFRPDTNVSVWLFATLHNIYSAQFRKRRRGFEDRADTTNPQREPAGRRELQEFREAFAALAPDQREAFILVGVAAFSYAEAAEICGCAVGTIKSRVNRARNKIAERLGYEDAQEFGPSTQALRA